MGPCAVCGSLTINATGHCAHCGTYRGVPGQPPVSGPAGYPGQPAPVYPGQPAAPGGYPPQPTGYPPSSGPPAGYPAPGSGGPAYPSSGGPAGYPPSSGAPAGYPSPGSAGPAYPASGGGPGTYPTGGGYPGYSQPVPPAGRNRPFLIPLVALASTLAVLVIAIVFVLVNRDDDPGTDPVANPTSSSRTDPVDPTSAPVPDPTQDNPDIDSCVVGTWRAVSHREEVQHDELGKLVFTGGRGSVLRLNADGTGATDYGSGTDYTAKANNKTIRLRVLGLVSYRYTAVDGRVSISDVKSNATFQFFIDDEQYGETSPFDASDSPSTYTCSGSYLTQKTLLYRIEYEKTS